MLEIAYTNLPELSLLCKKKMGHENFVKMIFFKRKKIHDYLPIIALIYNVSQKSL